MGDSKFTPDKIDLKSGRKVRMVLNNKSDHDNGLAIGLDVLREGGSATGFSNHFLAFHEILRNQFSISLHKLFGRRHKNLVGIGGYR